MHYHPNDHTLHAQPQPHLFAGMGAPFPGPRIGREHVSSSGRLVAVLVAVLVLVLVVVALVVVLVVVENVVRRRRGVVEEGQRG